MQAQQDMAHRISAAVAHELGFRREALTYIPWDINHLTRIVISIRAMRPHERQHPNIIECRDSPPGEYEEEDEEAAEEHNETTEADVAPDDDGRLCGARRCYPGI